ncbi:hypothetical protein SCHPADRAFT_994734 [Schizopora paradoxa]|uniref:Uncharacterized protein n=1 Tax=Schizopora paradoxa TaxID=27342 RepID=A0A0H2RZ91_9AGAM|nr:hypothetical protein SCHPADRAFT_994734 [Schizopora paradoxa]
MVVELHPMALLSTILEDLKNRGTKSSWEASTNSWPKEYSAHELFRLSGMKVCLENDDMDLLRSSVLCLRQASMALKLLEKIVDRTAATAMSSLNTLVSKRKFDVFKLPNEIVSLIFTYVHKSAAEDDDRLDINDEKKIPPTSRQSLYLTHICHHWRTLASSMPELWTTLSNLQHPGSVRHFIQLSKKKALDVTFVARTSMFCIMSLISSSFMKHDSFLALLMPLSKRWQSFDLTFLPDGEDEEVDAILPGLVDAFKKAKCNKLVKVSIRLGGWFNGLRDGSSASSIFSSWNAPKLRNCAVTDFIPSTPVSKGVTTLTIDLVDDLSDRFDYGEIFDFIGLHPNLSKLDIRFRPTNYAMFRAIESTTFQGGLDLPFLKKLQINVPVTESYDLIKDLLRSLSQPTLEDVTLDFRICLQEMEDEDLDKDLSLNFQSELNLCLQELSRHDSLRSFSLEVSQEDRANPYHSNNALESVFTNLPHLEHLEICAPDLPAPTVKELRAPLRTLNLNKCSRFDDKFIKEILGALARRDALDSFERLSVDGCEKLRKESAVAFLPSSKVAWE